MWTESSEERIIPEREKERERKQDDIPPPECSHRDTRSAGNRNDGGLGKKERKRGVISAPKIVSLPSFLSPGNSL